MLSEKTKDSIAEIQKLYPQKRSALIPALHLAQAEMGYLSSETQSEVAELFGIDPNEVNAIVTFYDMFFEEPTGKHLIHVCKNVSCMLRGCDQVLAEICRKLNVLPGERTADGEFTVIASECLGACDKAPVMLVDDHVVGPVAIADLDQHLENGRKGSGHPTPVATIEASHG